MLLPPERERIDAYIKRIEKGDTANLTELLLLDILHELMHIANRD